MEWSEAILVRTLAGKTQIGSGCSVEKKLGFWQLCWKVVISFSSCLVNLGNAKTTSKFVFDFGKKESILLPTTDSIHTTTTFQSNPNQK